MTFIETLQNEILVGDGAVGTMLYNKGVSFDTNFEHLNLINPAIVKGLHLDYLTAGSDIIETNTFGANRTRLTSVGLESKIKDINIEGVRIAKNAIAESGKRAYVAGSVGPLAKVTVDSENLTESEITDLFREQIFALAEGGADLIMLETFSDLGQILSALRVAKETGLPVITSMAYPDGGKTGSGVGVAHAARELQLAGTDVIGANCGAGPREILQTVKIMATSTDRPISAFANSGFPEYIDGRYIYRTTPEYFAEMGFEAVKAGAVIVGGCCGTTPEHIKKLAERIKGEKPVSRKTSVYLTESSVITEQKGEFDGFLAAWKKEKLITVELETPKGLDPSKAITGAAILKEAGADAINFAENPLARVRMGNIALANLIQEEVGIEVIVHITCRDRNLLGLQSDLMGASLLGIRSILAVTGDPARLGNQIGSSSVYDLNSFGLIKLLADLNSGLNSLGQPLGKGTGFKIGCAFNPNTPDIDAQIDRLSKKVAAGANFTQTQPVYSYKTAIETAEKSEHFNIPVLIGIMPLVSERNCEYLHNEVPGITIPDEIRKRMQGKEKEDGRREGLQIAKELIEKIYNKVDGFYIITPFDRHELSAELVQYIKSLKP
ncbi:MAG: bifunctional homocysteine S-methyltransferase/methylenetetrahydrofolate reductase [Desulfuromonadales bacterium]|nr:bifunctional homocysteine S-methyltransferase/methylenetetrahydrofolate reductase [Desulfuromonadales bacterium]